MTKVKICGLMRTADAEAVNEAEADFAGFVFAGSRRKISHDTAAELRSVLDPAIPAVGVFVDADEREIAELAEAGTIQMVQLHGNEDEAYIRRVKKETGLPVIKALLLGETPDEDSLRTMIAGACAGAADYLLFDTGRGTGMTFRWRTLAGLRDMIEKPYFAAGGLTPDNVGEAAAVLLPYAADVSGGVENADGYKDENMIREFVRRAKSE